jgi:L-glutamine-phosphate cytidylyltransferase
MRAVILAAGAGTRLSPLTDACPKCLVPAGRRPLIDYQLRALRAVGVDDIVVVVGYRQQQVRDYLGNAVRYVENPDYAGTNSIYSLHLAAAQMDAELFLFNCDIVFHPDVLRRLMTAPGPDAVAVDQGASLVPGEMNVAYQADRRIRQISKQLDVSQAQAQSVQLARFGAAGARLVRDEVGRLVAAARRDAFPTSAYGPLIATGHLFAVEVGGLPWGEVDSLADHARVAQDVVPLLPDP